MIFFIQRVDKENHFVAKMDGGQTKQREVVTLWEPNM